jgi:hypothetical protein
MHTCPIIKYIFLFENYYKLKEIIHFKHQSIRTLQWVYFNTHSLYDSNTEEWTKADTAEGTTPARGNQEENLPSATADELRNTHKV